MGSLLPPQGAKPITEAGSPNTVATCNTKNISSQNYSYKVGVVYQHAHLISMKTITEAGSDASIQYHAIWFHQLYFIPQMFKVYHSFPQEKLAKAGSASIVYSAIQYEFPNYTVDPQNENGNGWFYT